MHLGIALKHGGKKSKNRSEKNCIVSQQAIPAATPTLILYVTGWRRMQMSVLGRPMRSGRRGGGLRPPRGLPSHAVLQCRHVHALMTRKP